MGTTRVAPAHQTGRRARRRTGTRHRLRTGLDTLHGPALGAVQTLAEGSAARGALLGVAYCIGLGIPFLLTAAGFKWVFGISAAALRHARTVTLIGGVVLIVLGILLLTGIWEDLMIWMRAWLAATGWGTTSL